MKKLILILLIVCLANIGYAQEVINKNNFKNKVAKDIVVVEFWAAWNASNEFKELIKLKECNVYRIDITSDMDLQMDYSVEAIPTVIIFENGTEKERFKPNIMFQLDADKKTVQNSIDTLLLNKFQ
jgi:thiol-disulfide isomerase/thioredoxin